MRPEGIIGGDPMPKSRQHSGVRVWLCCRLNAVCSRVAVALCAMLMICSTANADELDRLFARVLQDPTNVAANLAYAEAALERDLPGKALAAYERVLETDPNNQEAQDAIRRLQVALIPVTTFGKVEVGGRYESNVRQQPGRVGRTDDFVGFARLAVYDQRPFLNQDWRSDFFGYADLHDQATDIDYWFARAHTGPTFDLGDGVTMQIAPGASVSFLDGDWYYVEPSVRVTFQNLIGGFISRLDVRGGYRDINSDIGATEGYSLDVVARHANRQLIFDSDLLLLQPFFRWRESDSQPAGVPVLLNTFVLGDYIEFGGQALYYVQPIEDLRLGAKFLGYYRDYEQSIRLGAPEREDYFLSPGAEVLLLNIACPGCDLKFDYRFEQNFSNDNTEDFFNHVVAVSAVKRF